MIIDKIASVTKNIPLGHEVKLTSNIPSQEGTVLAAEVQEDKKVYNKLELATGRFSVLKKGDIISVAIGNRKALRGFVGEIPKTLKVGDLIHCLNIGGGAGVCTSANLTEVGKPLQIKVLGGIEIEGAPANIKMWSKFSTSEKILKKNTKLILVSGTCMHVGKTSTACELIKYLSRNGYQVAAAKMTGVASLKDTENMKDYGASEAVSFIDAGITSTVKNGHHVADVFKGAINYLNQKNPEVIVVEFGDGVLGEYGVMEALMDKEIQAHTKVHIGCAHDPIGALKLSEICSEIGVPLNIISGPVTDNSVGQNFIADKIGIPTANAMTEGEKLFSLTKKIINQK